MLQALALSVKSQRITLNMDPPSQHLDVVIIAAGEAKGLRFGPELLQTYAGKFERVPCFVDHAGPLDEGRPGGRSVRDLAGFVHSVHYDQVKQALVGKLYLYQRAQWIADLAGEASDVPFFGLSADLWVRCQEKEVQAIEFVNSVDIVVNPAAGGRFLDEPQPRHEEVDTMSNAPEAERLRQADDRRSGPIGGAQAPFRPVEEESPARDGRKPGDSKPATGDLRRQIIELKLQVSGLPSEACRTIEQQLGQDGSIEQAEGLIAAFREAYSQAHAQSAIKGLGRIGRLVEPLDKITLAFERLMGLPTNADHRSAARLTGIRELYDLLTGDWERHGVFRPDRVSFANASTTTMANVVANVLNKVLLRSFESRPQWWKTIAYEENFPSINDVKWISVGGFADLDTVAEGGSYTEKTWDDSYETASFVKKGNYIGISMEMIDRDDVAAVRAVPRRLGLAANRTLSAAVAALFTSNSGTGPQLSDGDNLFHANHGNLGTSALSADNWDAVIQAMFKQTELNSSKRLGIRPSYCLVPIELEKTALTIFTSEKEADGSDVYQNVRRRNASAVVTVPDWTDATDWAAAADPNDLEGVCIGYRFGRAPEVFVADSELAGSMFTNDELRVKVRFVYALGIGNYRALYKNNVVD
ncbi:MAG TPA: Mu-like prophage major head subunit gpT family protein [Anaerolineae bacterium]|nr:Mu-like prophage major head subunit gpT family protein [Anaerolineae bacterium]